MKKMQNINFLSFGALKFYILLYIISYALKKPEKKENIVLFSLSKSYYSVNLLININLVIKSKISQCLLKNA